MRPTGTVTFLFSDIEASTQRLSEIGPQRYGELLEMHRSLLHDACARHRGHKFGSAGDSMFVAFASAHDALHAALDAQCAFTKHAWPDDRPLRARMGLHTCEATIVDDDYVGIGVHRASRICDAAHGGQVLVSHTARALIGEDAQFVLRDLGEHALKSLPEPHHLYQLVHPRLQAEFPALRTPAKRTANLPTQLTTMVGRDRDIDAICTILRDPSVHLLTLTGPGGTGKTRLAVQVAHMLADDFDDGANFASLASISDPTLVLPAIAQALSVSAAAGQSLSAYLAQKSMLIVLDNFEQIVTAAPEIASLIAEAPQITFLATSREPLHVTGERIFPVSPLTVPDPRRLSDLSELDQCASVRLFIERAQAVQPAFSLTENNAEAVAAICLQLDGLPLAIELAAARIGVLSPNAMAKRLPQRLSLLTAGTRDTPLRQQTIRNAIAWSFDLLSDDERALFARLGVFPGQFAIEVAEAVCETSLDSIGSLVDKSLVRRFDERLGMLETIRSFAVEKLDHAPFADSIRGRHATHFEALVKNACAQRNDDEKRSLDMLELEHENVRAVLDWLRARAPGRFIDLAGDLGWFWHLHSHFTEGRAYLAHALAIAGNPDQTRARLLSAAGGLAAWSGELTAARAAIGEAVAIWRNLGQEQEISSALLDLGWGCFITGEDVEARVCMEDSLRIANSVGERALINRARIGLLQVLVALGELDTVEPMAREALAEAERQRDARSEHFAHHFLADCPLIRGDGASALPRYRRALELAAALGERTETAIEMQGIAMASAGMGLSARALTLGGAAAAELERLGVDFSGIRFWSALINRYYAAAREALGPAAAEAAWHAGRRTDFETAVNEALSIK
jgi:predicted ATPase/class 3 adenylate cyclase